MINGHGFDYLQQAPASGGKPKGLVVLLHGVGSNGADLLGLAPYWAPLLPDVEFVSPNAPQPCDMAPHGFQWFSLQNRDPHVLAAGVAATAPQLDAFLDGLLAERGLGDESLALVGFSQGTMMSLYTAPRRARQMAAVVGFSGALRGDLSGVVRSRPPTLLVHGTDDGIVPYEAMAVSEKALAAAGVPVETLTCPGVGHTIDQAGLAAGGRFLARHLAAPAGA